MILQTNFTKDILENIDVYIDFIVKEFSKFPNFTLEWRPASDMGGEWVHLIKDKFIKGMNMFDFLENKEKEVIDRRMQFLNNLQLVLLFQTNIWQQRKTWRIFRYYVIIVHKLKKIKWYLLYDKNYKNSGTQIRKYPDRRRVRQGYKVISKIASNQKNVLIDQGREASHFLIGLSSVFEKVGLEIPRSYKW